MEFKITTKIELDTNKNDIRRFLFKTFTIDSNGNTLDETEYDSESNIVCKRIYRYFDTGEVREYVEYDPNEELLERHLYSKNDNGEIDKIELEFIGGQKTIKEFSFTDIGNADKAVIQDENGEITGYELYIFDEQGQIKEEIELDADKNEISKYEKAYFENGLLSNEKHIIDGKLNTEESFIYDKNGNLIKKIHTNFIDKFKVINDYNFDSKGNMIYNCSHKNGVLVFENKCGYNENNDLISEELFELEFWVRRIIRHERLIHEIKEKKIHHITS